jgi:hypothetical protein
MHPALASLPLLPCAGGAMDEVGGLLLGESLQFPKMRDFVRGRVPGWSGLGSVGVVGHFFSPVKMVAFAHEQYSWGISSRLNETTHTHGLVSHDPLP